MKLENIQYTTPHTCCKYKVYAVGFDRKGKVLGTCRNTPRFSRKGGSRHAEMNLMRKYGRSLYSILIFRITPGGLIRKIDPCSSCLDKAMELGIRIKTI